jgi:tetratricopeptide (TPR) repeat protein
MLADMLMEVNRPGDALVEYEKSMDINPNRFDELYGAGRAAELLGEYDQEQSYYTQLLKNCAGSGRQRAELAHITDVLQTAPSD